MQTFFNYFFPQASAEGVHTNQNRAENESGAKDFINTVSKLVMMGSAFFASEALKSLKKGSLSETGFAMATASAFYVLSNDLKNLNWDAKNIDEMVQDTLFAKFAKDAGYASFDQGNSSIFSFLKILDFNEIAKLLKSYTE